MDDGVEFSVGGWPWGATEETDSTWKTSRSDSFPQHRDRVRVFLRIRPLCVDHQDQVGRACVQAVHSQETFAPRPPLLSYSTDKDDSDAPSTARSSVVAAPTVARCCVGVGGEEVEHQFTFSRIFEQATSQMEVFESVAKPLVDGVLRGYNGTIFVYGQTGSGKTHTMFGGHGVAHLDGVPRQPPPSPRVVVSPREPAVSGAQDTDVGGVVVGYRERVGRPGSSSCGADVDCTESSGGPEPAASRPHTMEEDDLSRGIVPRVVGEIFARIGKALPEMGFEVRMFFVEVYMEKIRDLLNPLPSGSNLVLREDVGNRRFFIENCYSPCVTSEKQVMELVARGIRHRATSSTLMNDVSSRSHCLLSLSIRRRDTRRGESYSGKLVLVDLAGSEKVKQTKADGQQLEEAKLINKSLTALGLVIKCLTERPGTFVPYRNSMLTRILQDALGGNSRTALIICCSPQMRHQHETLSTLRFGARASCIQNHAVVNREYTVTELQQQLSAAHAEIAGLRAAAAVAAHRGGGSASSAAAAAATVSITAAPRVRHGHADVERDWDAAAVRRAMHLEAEVRMWESEYAAVCHRAEQQSMASEFWKRQHLLLLEAGTMLAQHLLGSRQQVSRLRQSLLGDAAPPSGREGAPDAVPGHVTPRQSVWPLDPTADTCPHGVMSSESLWVGSRRIPGGQLPPEGGITIGPGDSSGPDSAGAAAGNGGSRPPRKRSKSERDGGSDPDGGEGHRRDGPHHSGEVKDLRAEVVKSDSEVLPQLRGQVERLTAHVARIESSWKDLMREHESLTLELQLAEKKLAIRCERIESLKYGLRQERQTGVELQRLLERDRTAAKQALAHSRQDAVYWRERYDALLVEHQALLNAHRAAGQLIDTPCDDGANSSASTQSDDIRLPPFTFTPIRKASPGPG